MTWRLALRTLAGRPVRAAVLACGFGAGVAVMAALLGVGEVILEQARSPDLGRGGDVLVQGPGGRVDSARWVLRYALGGPPLAGMVAAASPAESASVYLVRDGGIDPVIARGGIPGLERAVGDPETSGVAAWVDLPGDRVWTRPLPEEVLRSLDRFHPVPDVPERADSWAEWLYFNGRAGSTRFYLTFLVGPETDSGGRGAGVRLQLERDGRRSAYSERAELDPEEVLRDAPDLTIGRCRVSLDGTTYRIRLDLEAEEDPRRRLTGAIDLAADPSRSIPPFAIHGSRGWVSGYTVPVPAGSVDGELVVGGDRVSLGGGTGYHDHNWGFWRGVTWRWGQVVSDERSFVYGRVLPPPDAGDPERSPAFVIIQGPAGVETVVPGARIEETDDPVTGLPETIRVSAEGGGARIEMRIEVLGAVATRMERGSFALAPGDGPVFYQLDAMYRVRGEVGGAPVDLTARGSAETFRR